MGNGMFDVSHKHDTLREATAQAIIRVKPATIELIREGRLPKGDIVEAGRISGTMAAKQTSSLIPFCHPIPIDHIKVEISIREEKDRVAAIEVKAAVKTVWKTGVEMESLTAACMAALTIYDMLKPVDDSLMIESVKLVEKRGGLSKFHEKQKKEAEEESDGGDRIGKPLRAAVLVMSDSRKEKQDESGKIIIDRLVDKGFRVEDYKVIPDDVHSIEHELKRFADELKVDMILTSGGTGTGPRDVTPEATASVIDKEIAGISEALRAFGQRRTPTSMLSRQVAGIRKNTVIINLPGSSRAVSESLDALFPGILHIYKVLHGGHGHPREL